MHHQQRQIQNEVSVQHTDQPIKNGQSNKEDRSTTRLNRSNIWLFGVSLFFLGISIATAFIIATLVYIGMGSVVKVYYFSLPIGICYYISCASFAFNSNRILAIVLGLVGITISITEYIMLCYTDAVIPIKEHTVAIGVTMGADFLAIILFVKAFRLKKMNKI